MRNGNIIQLFSEVVEIKDNPTLEVTSHKGGKRYRITLGKDANGMRVRRWLGTDEAGAKTIHKEIIKRIKNGDIKGLESAVTELYDDDSRLARKLLRPYGDISLVDCAKFLIKYHQPIKGHVSLTQALEAWKVHAEEMQFSDSYIKTMLSTYAGPFVKKHHSFKVMDITEKEARDWIFKDKKGINNDQKQQHINKLRSWFNTLAKLKYTFKDLNPFNEIEAPKTKFGIDAEEPDRKISPRFMEEMLNFALASKKQKYIETLVGMVLIGYCGIRTEEVPRLDWKHIKLDLTNRSLTGRKIDQVTSTITVPKLQSKMGYKRDNQIPENARCWLVEAFNKLENPKGSLIKNWRHNKGTGRSTEDGWKSRMNDFRKDHKKHCKLNNIEHEKYEQNGLRVSCASYGLYELGKEDICRMMGEKRDAVFWGHYHDYTNKEQASDYFNIYPEAHWDAFQFPLKATQQVIDDLCGITRA